MKNSDLFSRTRLLLGPERMEKLAASRVLVLGVGGVGGYAAEQLARAGVGHLVIVDGDRVEATNCNRQILALASTIGKPKVEVLAERLKEINPNLEIEPVFEFMRDEKIEKLCARHFDCAIDAIDSLSPKIHFILECLKQRIPLVSSMGSGGKTDPSQVRIADVSKTSGCALARAVRKRLRDQGVNRGVTVVFSPENVNPEAVVSGVDAEGKMHSTVGTISYMPAVFGCFCASAALKMLTE